MYLNLLCIKHRKADQNSSSFLIFTELFSFLAMIKFLRYFSFIVCSFLPYFTSYVYNIHYYQLLVIKFFSCKVM